MFQYNLATRFKQYQINWFYMLEVFVLEETLKININQLNGYLVRKRESSFIL